MNFVIAAGGTGGHLFPGIADGEVFLQRGDRVEVVDTGPAEDLYVRSLRAFSQAVTGNGVPAATGRDGVWSLAVALAAAESANTGRTVPISVDGP